MPIKNLSDVRRLPRLGKIHLGIKVKNESGVEYPKEVSYFVIPEKVQEIYGEKPTELKIMFPVENPDLFFQQWYKSYGFNLLKCKGDGQLALTWDGEKGGMKEIPCPCERLENGECKRIGLLQFLLPDVPGAGVWQISTSSRNSIIDINSSIDYIKSICGRIRMIPLILKRVETKIQRVENGKPKTGKHYTLQIDVDNISLRQLQQAAQIEPEKVLLPPPEESKDELLYPKNGFEPEKDEIQDEDLTDDILKAKERLDELREEFIGLGGEISLGTAEKINKFKTFEQYSAEIDRLQIEIDKKKRKKSKKNSEQPTTLFEGEKS